MSQWQPYIDTQLLQKQTPAGVITNCVEAAAIINRGTGAIEASTPGFSLGNYTVDVPNDEGTADLPEAVNEAAILLHAVHHKGESPSRAGIRINGQKYYFVSENSEKISIYLKKRSGGGVASCSYNYVIFASFNEELSTGGAKVEAQTPGLANERVETLAEYLRGYSQ
mmetsp:Transcript_23405/g.41525  ORF Transcript_23405/g.41525 Transcript_23405/m.41525 type:complete len:168 (+) Transcript_23405:2072-2575(+)